MLWPGFDPGHAQSGVNGVKGARVAEYSIGNRNSMVANGLRTNTDRRHANEMRKGHAGQRPQTAVLRLQLPCDNKLSQQFITKQLLTSRLFTLPGTTLRTCPRRRTRTRTRSRRCTSRWVHGSGCGGEVGVSVAYYVWLCGCCQERYGIGAPLCRPGFAPAPGPYMTHTLLHPRRFLPPTQSTPPHTSQTYTCPLLNLTCACVCVCVKEYKENVAQRQCMRCSKVTVYGCYLKLPRIPAAVSRRPEIAQPRVCVCVARSSASGTASAAW